MTERGEIVVETAAHVARLTITHPAKRNAVSYAMWREMSDALEALEDDADVRVVVVTGAGEQAFSAGNDISEFGQWRSSRARIAEYNRVTMRAYRALGGTAKPTIARIRGVCVGGGFELAQLCDIQVAAEDARFAVTPAKLGLGYKLEDVELLVRAVGVKSAKELLFTGRLFDAAHALRLGFVNRVVPGAELDAVVDGYAGEIAGNAPLSVRAAKLIIAEAVKPSQERDAGLCRRLVDACHESEDYQEGRRAFAQKRRPVFKGE